MPYIIVGALWLHSVLITGVGHERPRDEEFHWLCCVFREQANNIVPGVLFYASITSTSSFLLTLRFFYFAWPQISS
jgi:hypothetical protein